MNKSDIKLILIFIVISLIFIIKISLSKNNNLNKALVYYDGNLVMTIDLNINRDYEVMGENGKVLINVLDGKIRVNEENSKNHICSKQGFISKSYESIVCLPNKIVINISDDSLDAVVK